MYTYHAHVNRGRGSPVMEVTVFTRRILKCCIIPSMWLKVSQHHPKGKLARNMAS